MPSFSAPLPPSPSRSCQGATPASAEGEDRTRPRAKAAEPRAGVAPLMPRERLIAQGAAALTDAELLAILLGTGYRGKPVLALAEDLLARFGGPAGLMQADNARLRRERGLGGPAKRTSLLAVLELARRSLRQGLMQRTVLQSPQAVREYLQLELANLPHEVFAVLFLDSQHRLITYQSMFRGTLSQTAVYPREVAKQALALGASAVILAHNHPGGIARPSTADVNLTQNLLTTLALVDVQVCDHVIVCQGGSYSMREEGLL